MPTPTAPPENRQTRTLFAEEAGDIVRSHRKIEWRRPSRSEAVAPAEVERRPIFGSTESVEETVEQPAAIVVGGATLGTLLHKLMEEVLNGELEDGLEALVARASELMAQLSVAPSDQASDGISPRELAERIVRTLNIPEIAQLRPRLVTGRIEFIIDWKSDVDIDTERLNSYRGQLDAYRRHTGARHAFLVLMTTGKVMTA